MDNMDYFNSKNALNITKKSSNGVLGNMLHPTYPIEYVSVLGKCKSLDKVIRYANNRAITPHYLTHNYKHRLPQKEQYEPEHDGLLFLVLERIFADEKLVEMLKANKCLEVTSYTPVPSKSNNGVSMVRVHQFRYKEYPGVIEKILKLFSTWSEKDDPELTLSYAYKKLSHSGDLFVHFPSRSLILKLPE